MNPAAESIADDSTARRARIAVVEDASRSRSLLKHLVALLGYAAFAPADADLAVAAALAGHVDALVLDLDLAPRDGLTIVEYVRAQRDPTMTDRRVGAIAVTGYSSAFDLAGCLAAGFDRQVGKPVDIGDLRDAIAAVLPARRRPQAQSNAGSDADRVVETARRLRQQQSGQRVLGPTALEHFAMRTSRQVEQLRAALEVGNWSALDQAASLVRDDAAAMGALQLAELAATLLAARQGHPGAAAHAVARIEAEHAAILTVLLGRVSE